MSSLSIDNKPGQKLGRSQKFEISKLNDVHTHTYQRNIMIKNYKTCSGTIRSTLVLPEAFVVSTDKSRELQIQIIRSKFPNRPMEVILDGIRPHWTSFKCAIRRSDDEDDDMEFADVKFVKETNGNGSQRSGVFKDQLRDDLYMRITIVVNSNIENLQRVSTTINPPLFSLSKLYQRDQHCDFRLISCTKDGQETHEIAVHKCVLATVSPYFRAMFHSETAEAQSGQVQMTMIAHETLLEILHCVYTGEHSSNFASNCIDVLQAADFLEMLDLRDHCARWMSANFDRVDPFRAVQVALQLGLNTLAKQACVHIRDRVTEEESKARFLELLKNHPEMMALLIQLI
ncbi:hypothetical protein M3Y94_00890300 [Aphelenchoides besseyi]|nr:hypothetical protein M3Y94_00890300 [Aphelenchoides besseyi]KAI6223454.1 Speckle-type POZ protein-like protein [Aphelenchoides besseyi]